MNEYDDLLTTESKANEYDAVIQQQQDQPRQQLRASLITALPENPDQYAKAKQLSSTTGIPASVVSRNLPEVEQRAKLNEYDGLLETSPVLAGHLQTPEFAKVAHDDTENLSLIERAINNPVTRTLRSFPAGIHDFNAAAWGAGELLFKNISPLGELLSGTLLPENPLARAAAGFEQMRKSEEQAAALTQGSTADTGPLERGVQSGVRSATQIVPGLLASIFSGNPAFALGSGSATAGSQAGAKALDAGQSPGSALIYGAEDALAEYVTEKIPVNKLLGDLQVGAPLWKTLAHQIVTEVPTEMVATAWQNFDEWANLHPEQNFNDYVGQLKQDEADTIVSTITMSVLMAGGGHLAKRAISKQQQADVGTSDANALSQLAELAKASKLRERDPQSFQQFVDAAAQDGPVQDVYVDARTFAQAAGEALPEIAQASPAVAAQLTEALDAGGDLRIPLGDYATNIAASDVNAALLPHLRTAPEAMSMEEAKTFMQGQADEFKQEAERILTQHEFDNGFKESAASVEKEVLAQLTQANRFTSDVNTAYAKLMSSFYTVQAARLGITPEQMYVKYPLQIRAEALPGVPALEQGPTIEDTQAWAGEVKQRLGLKAFDVHNRGDGVLKLSMIEVDKGQRSQGTGSAALKELTAYADQHGLRIVLYPDSRNSERGTTSRTRLVKFYKRFGFVENKGRNKDFTISEGMVRNVNTLAQPAYHGSPHDFDRFSTEHIGSGEGAQAFGWGLYFAENPGIAAGYHERLAGNPQLLELKLGSMRVSQANGFDYSRRASENTRENIRASLAEDLLINENDLRGAGTNVQEHVLKVLDGMIADYKTEWPDAVAPAEELRRMLAQPGAVTTKWEKATGGVYQVDIPDDKVAAMLLWEKPLSEQPESVRKALATAEIKPGKQAGAVTNPDAKAAQERIAQGRKLSELSPTELQAWNAAGLIDQTVDYDPTGEELYQELTADKGSDEAASKYLYSIGIPGLKYLDGGSRNRPLKDIKREFLAELPEDAAIAEVTDLIGAGHFSPKNEAVLKALAADDWLGFDYPAQAISAALSKDLDNMDASPALLDAVRATQEGATHNLVVFDDAIVKLTHKDGSPVTPQEREEYFQQAGTDRGQIAFGDDITKQPTVMSLLRNADLSTFVHESGHFYLEVLSDMAAQPDAPAEVVADMDKLLQWFGVSDLATWRALTLEEKRPHHEQLARGFESYVMEGKAPSVGLSPLFARFRAWMVSIYEALRSLNVQVTDEVRGVFDRMIATNQEILAAEAARNFGPLFDTQAQAGMTADEWQNYQQLGQDATDDAVAQLQRRSVRDMQWLSKARTRMVAQYTRDASAKRKEVRAEVTDEVRRQPIYAAMRWLKHGETFDTEGNPIKAEAGNKLDVAALKEMYPETMLARPDLAALGVGKYGMVGKEGLPPDLVAEMFGFSSGDELVRKLLDAEPERSVIEGMTDQRMLERYGDLSSPDAISDAVDAAIHNDARAKFVATELRALERATGQRRSLAKAAKEFAAAIIGRRNIKEISPAQFAAAEARAARAADKALRSGDLAEAAAEKRKQLVNNYANKAAHEALDDVQKGVRYLKRVTESTTIDPDYRAQIEGLLERFDLRQISNKQAARRKSLVEWVEAQREQGLEPVIDPDMLNEALRKPYKEMSVEEFRGLVDAVRNIEHLGRLKHKLLTALDQRQFADRVAEAVASIEANAKRTLETRLEANTWTDAVKDTTAEFFAMHRKLANIIRELDGYKDGGVLWELIGRPMNAAGDNEAVLREQATIELSKIFEPIVKAGKLKEKMYIPAIDASLSREGRIAVALNTGNAGNLQRLMDGDRWSGAQVKAITDTLTKAEWDFVQAVWDHIASYQQRVGEQQKALTGIEPQWVEATPVQTPHGEYRGGYYPAKYDTSRSTRSLSDEAAAGLLDQWRAKRGSAKARDSFTKARADKVVMRPLRKDFGVVTQHVTEVTHRLAWQYFLVDANRLLRAGPIDYAIREHYGPHVLKAMRDTIEAVAAGEVPAQNAFERTLNYLRSGATIAGLGWRVTTALLQPIGLTQSMVRIGPKYVARGLAEWLGDATRMESTVKRIYDKSDFMRLRGKTMQREISEIRNQVAGQTSAIEASYFYLIQKLQIVADVPTWLGQYHKAIAQNADEKTAIAQADQAVLDAQGGGQIKDLAAIQRGGVMLKLFTNFYSFFNTTYNLTQESVGRTNFRNPLSVGRLATDLLLLYTIPAIMGTALKAALHGDDDWDKFVRQLIADQLGYLFGTMVGLRELAGAVQSAVGLTGDYSGPASVRFFSEAANLAKQVHQGEVDEALLKAADNVGGILFHYPAGQINATATGIKALAEGRTENPGALLVGAPRR